MPDLATHTLLSYLLAASERRRRALLLFLAGSVLPDAVRIPAVATVFLRRIPGLGEGAGYDLPASFETGLFVFHSPIPYALLCWGLALLFPPPDRWIALSRLVLGGWLHIACDLLQWHIGPGAYFPTYPIGRRSWELGLIGTEDSLYAIPVLAVAALWVAIRRRRQPSHRESAQ